MHLTLDTIVIALAILANGWTPRVTLSPPASAIVGGVLNILAILIVLFCLIASVLK